MEAAVRRGRGTAPVRHRGAAPEGVVPSAPHQLLRPRHDRAGPVAARADQPALRPQASRRPGRARGPEASRGNGRSDANAGRRRPRGEHRPRRRGDHIHDRRHPPRAGPDVPRGYLTGRARAPARRNPVRGAADCRAARPVVRGIGAPRRRPNPLPRPPRPRAHLQRGPQAAEPGRRPWRLRHPPGGRRPPDPDALPDRRRAPGARRGWSGRAIEREPRQADVAAQDPEQARHRRAAPPAGRKLPRAPVPRRADHHGRLPDLDHPGLLRRERRDPHPRPPRAPAIGGSPRPTRAGRAPAATAPQIVHRDHPGHRPNRRGQEHDALRRAEEHLSAGHQGPDRREPDRVRLRQLPPARGRRAPREHLRQVPALVPPPRSGRDHGRRDPGRRDCGPGVPRGPDGPPGAEHASHQRRDQRAAATARPRCRRQPDRVLAAGRALPAPRARSVRRMPGAVRAASPAPGRNIRDPAGRLRVVPGCRVPGLQLHRVPRTPAPLGAVDPE